MPSTCCSMASVGDANQRRVSKSKRWTHRSAAIVATPQQNVHLYFSQIYPREVTKHRSSPTMNSYHETALFCHATDRPLEPCHNVIAQTKQASEYWSGRTLHDRPQVASIRSPAVHAEIQLHLDRPHVGDVSIHPKPHTASSFLRFPPPIKMMYVLCWSPATRRAGQRKPWRSRHQSAEAWRGGRS